jgi:hypothetical protein
LACSRSIASNSALKLPTPKPREPWPSMISKKNVARSWPVGDRREDRELPEPPRAHALRYRAEE